MNHIVYIDTPRKGWSHMVCADIKSLHAFAEKIGIKKCWYQNKRGKRQPHYDIRESAFQTAINNGAVQISSKELLEFLKQHF